MLEQEWRKLRGVVLVALLLIGIVVFPKTVDADPGIDYIIIRDAPDDGGSEVGNRTYITGQNDQFFAAGYNNTSGFVRDVEVEWFTDDWETIQIVNPKYSTNATIVAKEYGTTSVYVAEFWSGNQSLTLASTGNLSVISDIDYVILRDEAGGGGEWFGDVTVMSETSFRIHAAGYNHTRGYLRDVPVYWYSTNESLCRVWRIYRSSFMDAFPYGEGSCHIWADYSPGVSNTTGLITVISDVDYIVIRDSMDGLGAVVKNMTYTIDQRDGYWAAGYNLTLGYLRDVPAYWTVDNESVCTSSHDYRQYSYIGFLNEGQCRVTANYAWLAWNITGTITAFLDIDYIIIRDAEAGGGQPAAGMVMYVGRFTSFYAAGYNYSGGFARDLTVEWSNSNESVCRRDSGGSKFYGIQAWVPGTCTISVTFWSMITNNTGNMTVVSDVDYIVIRDAPQGGGSVVGNMTLLLDYLWYYYYAAGYNITTGYIGDLDVTWTSSNTSVCGGGSSGGPVGGYYIHLRLYGLGTCNLTADFRGLVSNRTGELTIIFDIDYVIIRNASGGSGNPVGNGTFFTSDSKRFYAAGYNNTTGYSRDLDSYWSSSNYTVCRMGSTNGEIIFYDKGQCKITANYRGIIGGTTGNLTVLWDIDYLVVTNGSGGSGNPIGNRTYLLATQTMFYAAGYNTSLGYRRDLRPDWFSSNTTVCLISSSFYQSTLHLNARALGTCVVSANYLNRVSNSTGTITVVTEIDYIVVSDEPNGSGSWVGDRDYISTSLRYFYAAGHNITTGYVRDVEVIWTTNNSASCHLTGLGSIVMFRAKILGYCRVTADYHNVRFNSTGSLHITSRPIIVVDDDGGGNYTTIQEALDAAVDRAIIQVMNGTYQEHVVVNKSVDIKGLDKATTWVNGSGYGTVFHVTADYVRITGLTIEYSEYGIFLDKPEYTAIDHITVRWYKYGIYSNYSEKSHIEKNLVTEGSNGIVTYHSNNDAVWHNEISYNDNYGAKDYDSNLSKCFNWNYFHHNKIAYYYDPDVYLEPLLLDSNVFEDNEIGILVENASSIHVTNNTVLRSEVGISILNGSPFVGNNSITDVTEGIELRNSSSLVLGNTITDSVIGITALGNSPSIEMNVVRNSSKLALELESVVNASVKSNDFGEGQVRVSNSTLTQVQVRNESLSLINTTWEDLEIVGDSVLEVKWWIQLEILSGDGTPIQGANVRITDVQGNIVAEFLTDEHGLSPWLALTQQEISRNGTLDMSTYRVDVEVDGIKRQFELEVDSNEFHSIYFRSITEDDTWLLFFAATLALVILGLASTMSVERSRYAILAMFLIFYVKLKRKDVLEQFTRGRIMGYIEANPGAHFGALRKALSLSNGNAVHHLRVLEDRGFVSSKNDGMYKRFYPKGAVLPPDDGAPLPEIYQRVLSCIKGAPGISQKEIASLLGLHQSTLEYQLKKLVKAGLIRHERIGRRACYFLKMNKKK